MSQQQQAEDFHALHVKGSPVIIYNVWDAGSAKAVSDAGAKAIATGSAPVAFAQGYGDGENMPLEIVLENITRIIDAVSLPVSIDFEGAYSPDPEIGAANVVKAVEAGVIGINFEDQIVGGEGLHDIATQVRRIKAIRRAGENAGVNLFINARTDLFLKAKIAGEAPTGAMLEKAVERANAFEDAGASGFFAPGLLDLDLISQLCEIVALPVNIIALPGAPENNELAKAGVARISYGPVPYRQMIAWLEEKAREAIFSVE